MGKALQKLIKDICTISLILNMIAFVYILNICEYDVSNMYIMYTCMLSILLSVCLCQSVSVCLSCYDTKLIL